MLTNKYLMLPVIFVLAYVIRLLSEEKKRKPTIPQILVLSIIMMIPVGFSEIIGDRYMYVHHFLNILPENPSMFLAPLVEYFPESGWEAFNMVIKYFIANDERVFVVWTSMFIILPVVYRFGKDLSLFELAVFLFMTFGTYQQSENGLRQACATAILVLGYHVLSEGNGVYYVLLVLLAASFHTSALIFLVLFPLRYLRVDGRMMKWIGGVSILLFVLYEPLVRVVCWLFAGSRYIDVYTSWLLDESGRGANPLRIVWVVLPLIIAYLNREKLEEKEKGFRFIVNLSLVNLIISLFATKMWIFARFCFYFSTFEIYLICWEIQYLFRGRKRLLAYWVTIGFYFVYMLFA